MTPSESVHYLENAGIHYKPAESPDLWTHLESHFYGPRRIGPKFSPLSAALIGDMIAKGEAALLDAMVEEHRRTGRLGRITRLIEMPYVVGAEAVLPPDAAAGARVLRLIEQPGTSEERVIHVVPASADEIPCTHQVTVTGGFYADGHTAGYYDLYPGRHRDGIVAYLATMDEIESLAREMETRVDEIVIASRRECDEMIAKVKKALGG